MVIAWENEMAQVSEIVEGIYRICNPPTLIHTGFYESYDAVRAAVAEVVDPNGLAYVIFGHFEADECGGNGPVPPRRRPGAPAIDTELLGEVRPRAAQLVPKLKQTAGQRESHPVCSVIHGSSRVGG